MKRGEIKQIVGGRKHTMRKFRKAVASILEIEKRERESYATSWRREKNCCESMRREI